MTTSANNPAPTDKDSATGIATFGYLGAIARGPAVPEADVDVLDAFDRTADAFIDGPARINAERHSLLVEYAKRGLQKGVALREIRDGAVYLNDKACRPQLSEAGVKAALQLAVKQHRGVAQPGEGVDSSAAAGFDPKASRVGDVFTVAPTAPKFIVLGYLPVACGQENAIGGAGKTTRRMCEGIHIILGRPLYGRPILQPGPVLVVTKEDGADIFKYRLHHVAAAMGLSAAEQKRVAEHFHVLDMSGEVAGRLVCADREGNLQATDLPERIYKGYRQEGMAQVSFDPWNLFGPGERFVNDAEASLMAAGALVSRELACNVCYVGHVSKAVGRQGIIDAHSGRGGAAMGDNARFVLSYVNHDLKNDKEWPAPAGSQAAAARGDLYRLHITKQSYAKRDLAPIWIERSGYAFTMHEGAPASQDDKLKADGERIKTFVKQELEKGVKYSARALYEQHDRYSISRDRARTVIARLQAGGDLIERPLPDAEKLGRRTHYLEPVFAEIEPSAPFTGSATELFNQ